MGSIEPHRFEVITSTSNSLNAKYNIIGFKAKNNGQESLRLTNDSNITLQDPTRAVTVTNY